MTSILYLYINNIIFTVTPLAEYRGYGDRIIIDWRPKDVLGNRDSFPWANTFQVQSLWFI